MTPPPPKTQGNKDVHKRKNDKVERESEKISPQGKTARTTKDGMETDIKPEVLIFPWDPPSLQLRPENARMQNKLPI